MNERIFLKIGKKNRGCKVEASTKPDYEPLKSGDIYIPTLLVALDVSIDDNEFSPARINIKLNVNTATPCISIHQTK